MQFLKFNDKIELKIFKMKKQIPTLIIFFLLFLKAEKIFSQYYQDYYCKKIKLFTYYIPKNGNLFHIICKNQNKQIDNLFIMVDERTGEIKRLNMDYPIKERSIKINSVGAKFFIINTSFGNYKYDFTLNSWSKNTIKLRDDDYLPP